ncbi:hypothetical protein BO70DRAFT_49096 [Aspergillus heteromorphus CBS 117.55]|uniref:Uncharacterized protein n=1 Tax=Aspergillus heteromorphus CBS 117.55 TaxID=1448321 RepID=A0A317VYV2_9EURO|nr:uncharacterized protein BO70DRAFT_49096 [Aspergillus heteromorphus CBS 117.55]PWY79534.1 hypothetical protein BO70DRAFT_49096 [Aspergillus heteromorphus CBS 117.55]
MSVPWYSALSCSYSLTYLVSFAAHGVEPGLCACVRGILLLGERSNLHPTQGFLQWLYLLRGFKTDLVSLSDTMPWSCAYCTSTFYSTHAKTSHRVWSELSATVTHLTVTSYPLGIGILALLFSLLLGFASAGIETASCHRYFYLFNRRLNENLLP